VVCAAAETLAEIAKRARVRTENAARARRVRMKGYCVSGGRIPSGARKAEGYFGSGDRAFSQRLGVGWGAGGARGGGFFAGDGWVGRCGADGGGAWVGTGLGTLER